MLRPDSAMTIEADDRTYVIEDERHVFNAAAGVLAGVRNNIVE
jgi:hypothetical protein